MLSSGITVLNLFLRTQNGDNRRDTGLIPLITTCAGGLLLLNASWHLWLSSVPGSQLVCVVAGSVLYFGALRVTTGIRFSELSPEARFVVVSSTVLLVAFLGVGRAGTFTRNFATLVPTSWLSPLYPFLYFVAGSVFFRTLAPLWFMRRPLRQSPTDYGYRLHGYETSQLGRVYVALFLLVIPLVIWTSSRPAFQAAYPQGGIVNDHGVIEWPIFIVHQAAYFLLFLSGESFWRGYMTFGLGRDLGLRALPWMVMIYSIAHYGKPQLEVNGAIVAGSVLGYLALRHGSFWLGVVLHWSIAFSMDLAVILRTGVIFK